MSKDIKYYAHRCKCGCGGRIQIKRHHKYTGVPQYLLNHHKVKPRTKKPFDKQVDAILSGSRKAPLCACGCGNRIVIKHFHRYEGIPKYIRGHYIKGKGKQPACDPVVAAKISKAHKGIGHKHSDITKELCKFKKGVEVPGPDWWKNFDDFIHTAMALYDINRATAKEKIHAGLVRNGLSEQDIEIFLNWNCGHSFKELVKKYNITFEKVVTVLKHFEKLYPGICQSQVTCSKNVKYCFDLLMGWETIIAAKF